MGANRWVVLTGIIVAFTAAAAWISKPARAQQPPAPQTPPQTGQSGPQPYDNTGVPAKVVVDASPCVNGKRTVEVSGSFKLPSDGKDYKFDSPLKSVGCDVKAVPFLIRPRCLVPVTPVPPGPKPGPFAPPQPADPSPTDGSVQAPFFIYILVNFDTAGASVTYSNTIAIQRVNFVIDLSGNVVLFTAEEIELTKRKT